MLTQDKTTIQASFRRSFFVVIKRTTTTNTIFKANNQEDKYLGL